METKAKTGNETETRAVFGNAMETDWKRKALKLALLVSAKPRRKTAKIAERKRHERQGQSLPVEAQGGRAQRA